MSSTKEGNPPIAIKVKNAATNISIEPLAYINSVAMKLLFMCVDDHVEINIKSGKQQYFVTLLPE